MQCRTDRESSSRLGISLAEMLAVIAHRDSKMTGELPLSAPCCRHVDVLEVPTTEISIVDAPIKRADCYRQVLVLLYRGRLARLNLTFLGTYLENFLQLYV